MVFFTCGQREWSHSSLPEMRNSRYTRMTVANCPSAQGRKSVAGLPSGSMSRKPIAPESWQL